MDQEKKFIKGFNAGYKIAKHSPELSQKLTKGIQQNENPIVQGFFAGTQEYNLEKLKARFPNFSKTRQRDDKGKDYSR